MRKNKKKVLVSEKIAKLYPELAAPKPIEGPRDRKMVLRQALQPALIEQPIIYNPLIL